MQPNNKTFKKANDQPTETEIAHGRAAQRGDGPVPLIPLSEVVTTKTAGARDRTEHRFIVSPDFTATTHRHLVAKHALARQRNARV
jgi:hypothetical protein